MQTDTDSQETPAKPTLRILNCLHRSHLCGAQHRVVWVGEQLQEANIQTTVVFPSDSEEDYEKMLQARDFPYLRLRFRYLRNLRQVVNNLLFLLALPLSIWRFMRTIRQHRIDLVHVSGVTNLQPVLAGLLSGKPVLWHFNDMLTPKAYVRLVSVLFAHPRLHLGVATPEICRHYKFSDRATAACTVIPAPFPPPGDHHAASQRIRTDLGLGEDDRLVGSIGNLLPLKGIGDFLDAAETLLAEDEHLHAVVVGGEFETQRAYAEEIKRRAAESPLSDRIHLVGFQADVYAWLGAMDLLLFTSHTEACPVVVLQAMAIGAPLVATRVGEVPNMIADTGAPLVDPADVPATVEAARETLALSSESRAALSDRLRARVEAGYSLAHVVAVHEQAYRQDVETSGP